MKLNWRRYGTIIILILTVAAFIYYFAHHPQVGQALRHSSPAMLSLLLLLYAGSMVTLALITIMILHVCKIRLKNTESFLLTAYTAVINFFGPLQSGPAFRAAYLKRKHNVDLKLYAVAILGYLFFWGMYSSLFLLSGLLKWWLAPLIIIGLAVTYVTIKSTYIAPRLKGLDLHNWYYLALATFLQICFVTLIYYTELRSVAHGTSFAQAIVYTGAANLALFVSITPAAIGFRESFLLFSQHLHHISTTTIVAANILDRAVYIVLLLFLALFIFTTHVRTQLVGKDA